MSPLEAYNLIASVESDYVAMVNELNRHKNRVNPVNPWKMIQVERMEKALNDLALAAGIDRKHYRP